MQNLPCVRQLARLAPEDRRRARGDGQPTLRRRPQRCVHVGGPKQAPPNAHVQLQGALPCGARSLDLGIPDAGTQPNDWSPLSAATCS
jgi:hypothetical protein